jgi:uncharacterized protein (UPF0212 family)
MGDSGENVCTMCRRPFDAISMINSSLAGLVINIKILEIVVKVDTSSTKIATEESGMSCKDCGEIDMTFSTKWDSNAGLPFVKVGNDCSV